MLKPGARPIRHASYEVPYALREQVTNELRKKIQEGRYVRVSRSLWASPVWPVPKPNSSEVRVVHDYKRTINSNIVVDHYPLPIPEDIFNSLYGCRFYCVVDCADAYMQVKLDEQSQECLVLNTCIGLLKPTRLPYGLASASAIFQSIMDQILQGCRRAKAYVDDVIIGGENLEECRKNLYAVLERLNQSKVRIKVEKMQLYVKEVEFLGHVLGENSVRPSPKRVKAVLECATPVNVSELRLFLGMINVYNKFIPRACDIFQALHNLLSKNVKWHWDAECVRAFEMGKKLMSEAPVLTMYDPTKTLVLITDASPIGIAAVLAIRDDNGEEHPVAYISKSLTQTQQKYSQLEREGLSIVTALSKLHKFLAARRFILVTDNMPLKSMFSPDKTLPKVAALRIQRWAVLLSYYDYVIEYRKSELMGAADALSRLPLKEFAVDQCHAVCDLPELPISVESVMLETEKDPQLSKTKEFIEKGWPAKSPAVDLNCYFDVRYALSTENNCVMLGDKVVIPSVLRNQILKLLHEGHPGITRMKLRARANVWWPNVTSDIENYVRNCDPCVRNNFKSVSTEKVPWKPTEAPWERIHLDFFFLKSQSFLICVDSFSKWIEVWYMTNTKAHTVIEKLLSCFAVWGLPIEIVSDNGPPFTSLEFLDFCTNNAIVASKSAPYHPEGNGLAERGVQTTKDALYKALESAHNTTMSVTLANFLMAYRNTPCTVTKQTPAEMLLKRVPRTLMSILNPAKSGYVPKVSVKVNDEVMVRMTPKHEPFRAKVLKIVGPTLLQVASSDKVYQVSVNQVQNRVAHPGVGNVEQNGPIQVPMSVQIPVSQAPPVAPVQIPVDSVTPNPENVVPVEQRAATPPLVGENEELDVMINNATPSTPVVVTRQLRPRDKIKQPSRFNDYV